MGQNSCQLPDIPPVENTDSVTEVNQVSGYDTQSQVGLSTILDYVISSSPLMTLDINIRHVRFVNRLGSSYFSEDNNIILLNLQSSNKTKLAGAKDILFSQKDKVQSFLMFCL